MNKVALKDRFYEEVLPEPNTGCWLWTGAVHSERKPYGRFGFEGRTVAAHRMSYQLHKGRIPTGMFVCHKCDNPNCVNPDHLFLGTYLDNIQDRNRKGRQARGTRHGRSKLTPQQVLAIRKMTGGDREIGAKFGIKTEQARRIRLRINWAHLNEEG